MNIITYTTNTIDKRVELLNNIIETNTSMKLFDKDVYNDVYDIVLCFKEFAKLCESLNVMIKLFIDNIDNKDKLKGLLSSVDIYLTNINNNISNMIYLTKKLGMKIKPKYLGNEADVLFDYNVSFSYDNLKDNTNIQTDINLSSNVCIMKQIYKTLDDYFEEIEERIQNS